MTEQKRREGKLRPCSVCGQTNHSRPTNKLCPHYIPPRRTLTPLKRTSIIKSSLTNCCRNPSTHSADPIHCFEVQRNRLCRITFHATCDFASPCKRSTMSSHRPGFLLSDLRYRVGSGPRSTSMDQRRVY